MVDKQQQQQQKHRAAQQASVPATQATTPAIDPRKILPKRPANEVLGRGGFKVGTTGLLVSGRTENQNKLVSALRDTLMSVDRCGGVVAAGPAGCGKSYLAVVAAVAAYQAGLVEKILITRPLVPNGEGIGFLPGTESDKVSPWLRGAIDAIDQVAGGKKGREDLITSGVVEVCAIDMLRGANFRKTAFIIDEAQNLTIQQAKNVVTRPSEGSYMFVCGDPSDNQNDLPAGTESGLSYLISALRNSNYVKTRYLTADDCQRGPMTMDVVRCLEAEDKRRADAALKAKAAPSQPVAKTPAAPRSRVRPTRQP